LNVAVVISKNNAYPSFRIDEVSIYRYGCLLRLASGVTLVFGNALSSTTDIEKSIERRGGALGVGCATSSEKL
jgi:hypothetical protein